MDLSKVPPPPPIPIKDTVIVAGQRIGPVSLGMPLQDLYAAMGDPLATVPQGRNTSYVFRNLGATVNNQDGKVHEISASGPYTTDKGLHEGSSELAVKALYPDASVIFADTTAPEYRIKTYCRLSGLRIGVMKERVTSISVRSPGC